MLFKTDENLPAEIADLFRENGLDCVTVHAQGLAGQSDSRVSEVCREEGRVLVPLDAGFANIRAYPPVKFPGFIVLRPRRRTRPTYLASRGGSFAHSAIGGFRTSSGSSRTTASAPEDDRRQPPERRRAD